MDREHVLMAIYHRLYKQLGRVPLKREIFEYISHLK